MESHQQTCLWFYVCRWYCIQSGIDREAVINSITRLFETNVPFTYIADGHHRAASAAKVSKQLSAKAKLQPYFSPLFSPASQLAILDYNRGEKTRTDWNREISATRTTILYHIKSGTGKPTQLHEFGLYLEGKWYISLLHVPVLIPMIPLVCWMYNTFAQHTG